MLACTCKFKGFATARIFWGVWVDPHGRAWESYEEPLYLGREVLGSLCIMSITYNLDRGGLINFSFDMVTFISSDITYLGSLIAKFGQLPNIMHF